MAKVGQGEVIGEIAALLGGKRTATVRATVASEVLTFTAEGVAILVDRAPGVVEHLFETATRRLRETQLAAALDRHFGAGVDPQSRRSPSALTIALLVVAPSIDGHKLTTQFAEQLSQFADTRQLWAGYVDDQLGRPGIANSPRDTPGDLRVRYWLDDAEKDHEVVVLETDPDWTPWTKRALGQADHVLIVVDATAADPAPGTLESAVYDMFHESLTPPRTTLVLLHPADADDPRETVRWLESRPVTDHLHIRQDDQPHLARLDAGGQSDRDDHRERRFSCRRRAVREQLPAPDLRMESAGIRIAPLRTGIVSPGYRGNVGRVQPGGCQPGQESAARWTDCRPLSRPRRPPGPSRLQREERPARSKDRV